MGAGDDLSSFVAALHQQESRERTMHSKLLSRSPASLTRPVARGQRTAERAGLAALRLLSALLAVLALLLAAGLSPRRPAEGVSPVVASDETTANPQPGAAARR